MDPEYWESEHRDTNVQTPSAHIHVNFRFSVFTASFLNLTAARRLEGSSRFRL